MNGRTRSRQALYIQILTQLDESLAILDCRMEALVEETNRSLPHRHGSLMLRAVRCRKPGCLSCPHGPYWVRMIRTQDGRWRSQHIGLVVTQEDIERARLKLRAVREANRKIVRLREQRKAVIGSLHRAYRLLVDAEKKVLRGLLRSPPVHAAAGGSHAGEASTSISDR